MSLLAHHVGNRWVHLHPNLVSRRLREQLVLHSSKLMIFRVIGSDIRMSDDIPISDFPEDPFDIC